MKIISFHIFIDCIQKIPHQTYKQYKPKLIKRSQKPLSTRMEAFSNKIAELSSISETLELQVCDPFSIPPLNDDQQAQVKTIKINPRMKAQREDSSKYSLMSRTSSSQQIEWVVEQELEVQQQEVEIVDLLE